MPERNAFKLNSKSFIGWLYDGDPRYKSDAKMSKKEFAREASKKHYGDYYMLDIVVKNGYVTDATLMG